MNSTGLAGFFTPLPRGFFHYGHPNGTNQQHGERMKPELVNGWRTWWRQWSTWLAFIGSTVATFAPQLSEALLHAWTIIPLDIKATFPPEIVKYAGYAIAVLSIPAKLVRQRKLHAEACAEDERRGYTPS